MTSVQVHWDWLQTIAWVMGRSLDAIREVDRLRRESPGTGADVEQGVFVGLKLRDSDNFSRSEQEVYAACLAGRIAALGRTGSDLTAIPADHWSNGKVWQLSHGDWALGHDKLGDRAGFHRTEWSGLRFRSDDVRRQWPHPQDAAVHFLPAGRFEVRTGSEAFQHALWDKLTNLSELGEEYQHANGKGAMAMAAGVRRLTEALSRGDLASFAMDDAGALHRIPREYWLRERDPVPDYETREILFTHPYQLSDDLSDVGWRQDLRGRPIVVNAAELPNWREAVAGVLPDDVATAAPDTARPKSRSRRPTAQQRELKTFLDQAARFNLLPGGDRHCSMEDLFKLHYQGWRQRKNPALGFSAFKDWVKRYNDGAWPWP